MIDLKLNTELIEVMKQEGFSTDTLLTQYLTLCCMIDKEDTILNLLDDNKTSKRFVLQYYDLARKGLVEETPNHDGFVVTNKGKTLIESLRALMQPKKVMFDGGFPNNVEEWFDEWMDLWPKGIKSGGKLLRSDKMGCLKKMKKFVSDSGYSKDTILDATKAYLDEREKEQYQYCKTATYFISKTGEGSELSAWCDQIAEEGVKPKDEFEVQNTGGLI